MFAAGCLLLAKGEKITRRRTLRPVSEQVLLCPAKEERDRGRETDELKGSAGSGDDGSRQGLPPEVLAASMEVARLRGEQQRFSRPMCPRETDVSETKLWYRR